MDIFYPMKNSYAVIKGILQTEKGTNIHQQQNGYLFRVDKRANKLEIKHAAEELFKVNVMRVRTITMRGKKRRVGRYEGKRPDWKKAVVILKPGQVIKGFEGA